MNTNEIGSKAPEKIYLDSYGSGFSHGFHTNKLYDNDIEYTRTDAFFKKLEEWLAEYISDLASVDTHILVGSFKNYMEGKL